MKDLSCLNKIEELSNGLILGFESRYDAPIASICMLLPAGFIQDSSKAAASILAEMIFRGAGKHDGKSQMFALEHIGARRSALLGAHHLAIRITVLEEQFEEACSLLSDIVFSLHLKNNSLEAARALAIQNIASLQDNPHENVMLIARKAYLPPPYERNSYGDLNSIKNLSLKSLKEYKEDCFVPSGSWLGIAGALDYERVKNTIAEQFSGWLGQLPHSIKAKKEHNNQKFIEIQQDSSQAHIALICDGGSPLNPKEVAMNQILTRILGGATSGRLFSEVRQRHSLCYAVGSSYVLDKSFSMITTYAGTTPDRARKTVELILKEFQNVTKGVQPEEFERAQVGLVSKVLFSGESTSARAGAIASDLFYYGQIRTLSDRVDLFNSICYEDFQRFLFEKKFGLPTLAIIGAPTGICEERIVLDD